MADKNSEKTRRSKKKPRRQEEVEVIVGERIVELDSSINQIQTEKSEEDKEPEKMEEPKRELEVLEMPEHLLQNTQPI